MDTLILANAMLFLSTLSLRRATDSTRRTYHKDEFLSTLSLRRATLSSYSAKTMSASFLSTLSLRRATVAKRTTDIRPPFLSTLSLRRATAIYPSSTPPKEYFYPRSPCGERPVLVWFSFGGACDFYPRSPCGERPHPIGVLITVIEISIHALLAESDHYDNYNLHCVEISIHALLAESDASQGADTGH